MADLFDLARIYADMAKTVMNQISSFGARQHDVAEAAMWDLAIGRMSAQASTLRTLSSQFNDLSALETIAGVADEIGDVTQASLRAQQAIDDIADINRTMKVIARVIEVGSAIVFFAANPAGGTAIAIVTATDALLEVVRDE